MLVGYRVMIRALHEALRARLGISDEPAERMPYMRFQDMLAEAVRKDPAVGEVCAFENTPCVHVYKTVVLIRI